MVTFIIAMAGIVAGARYELPKPVLAVFGAMFLVSAFRLFISLMKEFKHGKGR